MDLGAAGLREQPFPTHGKPLAIVTYESQRQALDVLRQTLEHPTGLSLLQGPVLSGKSLLIRSYLDSIDTDFAVALIDGKGLNTTGLLLALLHEFGYDIDLTSANELLGLVRVFAMQQAVTCGPPLIVIENAHELDPGGLRVLCDLAALRVRMGSAIKMVFVSDRALRPMINAPAMHAVSRRLLHDFHLRPMNADEARDYLHEKLVAAGSDNPASIFPAAICEELWQASGGWPGIIDRIALLAIAKAESLPVTAEMVEHPTLPNGTWDEAVLAAVPDEIMNQASPPRLIVTNNGSVLQELTMVNSRLLVGRSEHNDISISSRFISRHHALLTRSGGATFLMDLNSTNGTFVNSTRVSNHVLRDNDIITVGHHRIKFCAPYAQTRGEPDPAEFADTAIMKSLQDMRSLLARENTALLPTATEDLPTVRS